MQTSPFKEHQTNIHVVKQVWYYKFSEPSKHPQKDNIM